MATNRMLGIANITAEIAKATVLEKTRRFGFYYGDKAIYVMDRMDVCYKIGKRNFVLDKSKLAGNRIIKVDLYKQLFSQSKIVNIICQDKKINGEKMTIFDCDGTPIYVPYERYRKLLFGRPLSDKIIFVAKDEYSPVFACDSNICQWDYLIGFMIPVQVSDPKRKRIKNEEQ